MHPAHMSARSATTHSALTNTRMTNRLQVISSFLSPHIGCVPPSWWSAKVKKQKATTLSHSLLVTTGCRTGKNTISTNRRMEQRGRPPPAVVFGCFHASSGRKICSQGQSPHTYSIWVIGNDNCYVLNFPGERRVQSAAPCSAECFPSHQHQPCALGASSCPGDLQVAAATAMKEMLLLSGGELSCWDKRQWGRLKSEL